MTDLADLQRRFFAAIVATPSTHLDAVSSLLPALTGESREARERRISVYRGAFRARMTDVLRDDFPCVAAWVGRSAFLELVETYVAAHPPGRPSLRHVGAYLPRFLAQNRLSSELEGIADLAQLEWARVEVFDAPNHATLDASALAAIPAASWETIAFEFTRALQVVPLSYNVEPTWRWLDAHDASEAGESDDGARSSAPSIPERVKTTMLVWRRDFQVFHRIMAEDEAAALTRLVAGERFATACEVYVSPDAATDVDAPAAKAFAHLAQWIVDGLIVTTRDVDA